MVSPGEKIKVEKMDAAPGEKVRFSEVLFFEDEKGEFLLGTPYLTGVKVEGEVLEEGLGEKKRVFKYKPKKRYKVKKGARQPFTEVEIKEIKLETSSSKKGSSTKGSATKKSSSSKETSKKEK